MKKGSKNPADMTFAIVMYCCTDQCGVSVGDIISETSFKGINKLEITRD